MSTIFSVSMKIRPEVAEVDPREIKKKEQFKLFFKSKTLNSSGPYKKDILIRTKNVSNYVS